MESAWGGQQNRHCRLLCVESERTTVSCDHQSVLEYAMPRPGFLVRRPLLVRLPVSCQLNANKAAQSSTSTLKRLLFRFLGPLSRRQRWCSTQPTSRLSSAVQIWPAVGVLGVAGTTFLFGLFAFFFGSLVLNMQFFLWGSLQLCMRDHSVVSNCCAEDVVLCLIETLCLREF